MYVEAYVGETIKLETSVLNADGTAATLLSATAKFGIAFTPGDTSLYDCVITENVVSCTLPSADTTKEGIYPFEFRLKMNNEVRCLAVGTLGLTKYLLTSI